MLLKEIFNETFQKLSRSIADKVKKASAKEVEVGEFGGFLQYVGPKHSEL